MLPSKVDVEVSLVAVAAIAKGGHSIKNIYLYFSCVGPFSFATD